MNKTIATIAAAAVLGTSGLVAQNVINDLSMKGSVGFESMYIFRGKKQASYSLQPSVELGYPVAGGNVYGGMWSNQPLKRQNGLVSSEIDLYGGYSYPVMDYLTTDVGYTYYWYPESASPVNRSNEIYFGLTGDTSALGLNLSPSVYYYYDFNLQAHTVEGSLSYSFDLSPYAGISGLSIDPSAFVGYVHSDKANGDETVRAANGFTWKNGYTYYGARADLVYKITDHVSASFGVRYSGNNDGYRGTTTAPNAGRAHNIWYGASVSFSK